MRLLIPAVAALSGGAYILAGWAYAGSLGYPLDDSWIHQTLARNLIAYGQWAINPGEPISVSTAPLWTLLLALGYSLGLPPMLWTHLLGGATLALVAWQTVLLGNALFPRNPAVPWTAGLLMLVEWHLVWAAFSGMETLLFTALSLAALREALQNSLTRPWLLGGLVGLLTLTRPEGLLVGLLLGGWSLLVAHRGRWQPVALFFFALALTVGPGVLLNLFLDGRPLPSTFFAKNAAYGIGPHPLRYAQFLGGAAIELARGPLLLAYPGLLYWLAWHFTWDARRSPDAHSEPADRIGRPGGPEPSALGQALEGQQGESPRRAEGRGVALVGASAEYLPLLWGGLLVAVYMVWLPALYHHGRYLLPLIPLLALYGLEGGRLLLTKLSFKLLSRVAIALLGFVVVVSWLRGAQVYGENVRSINQQQVHLARWIQEDTPADALVGTHDIGALGYFSQRRLVDIAGLASPELLTSVKDVSRILQVLQEKGVSYLVILPEWYPPLYAGLMANNNTEKVFEAPSPSSATGRPGVFQVLRLTDLRR